ncbi:hypothetical protein AB833_14675 [Chromatiales bacterium (ex Bugula neritina AB1)]|nr:hypothetical protein AB833_14675 [Chromatiales bacterium (ex Bugula neritina AB1)]
MTSNRSPLTWHALITALFLFNISSTVSAQNWAEVNSSDGSTAAARHESAAVEFNGMIYLFGGRHIRPVNRYNPDTNIWEIVVQAPLEMHHIQPVVYDGKIYIIGALACCFPREPVIADIHVFDPADNSWSTQGAMPTDRARGAAGTVIYNNKIYVMGGNTLGHDGGAVAWFDEYDPATGQWRILADSPNARDHYSAGVIGNKFIAAGGRQTNRSIANTVAATDIYNFDTETWSSAADEIPTQRAGTMAVVYDDQLYVMGGESGAGFNAHKEVEVFNPATGGWSILANMLVGRHAGGAVLLGSQLHVMAGSTTIGAAGETGQHESIDLALAQTTPYTSTLASRDTDLDGLTDYTEITIHLTNPNLADTDGDGITDGAEVNEHSTNPLNTDSDNDTLTDGDEILVHLSNPTLADSDADGLSDPDELSIHQTSPVSPDTDNDTISDGDEITVYQSNPNAADSDGDGVSDGDEVTLGSSLVNIDEDNDGLINSADGVTDSDGDGIPNYRDRDSDNDGISDLRENGFSDVNLNGQLDTAEEIAAVENANVQQQQAPENGADTEVSASAPTTTGLQLLDSSETVAETPAAPQTLLNEAADEDLDGIPNYLDLDSDQDGIPDLVESSGEYATIRSVISYDAAADADLDGLIDSSLANEILDTDADMTPDYLDLDSDGDGVNDVIEFGGTELDLDADGRIDAEFAISAKGIFESPQLSAAVPDRDKDNIPDVIDSVNNSNGVFGCSIAPASGQSSSDPLFPAIILTALSLLWLRRTRSECQSTS